jgi:hypothetical protein
MMSDRLAVSSALSVLMMAAYVLLGPNTAQAPLGPDALAERPATEGQLLPQASALIEVLR